MKHTVTIDDEQYEVTYDMHFSFYEDDGVVEIEEMIRLPDGEEVDPNDIMDDAADQELRRYWKDNYDPSPID